MDIEILILEYVLLVSGILLALFIDKLNEKRRHKNRIHSIMSIVIKNFNTDLKNIKKTIRDITIREALYNKIINDEDITEEEIASSMNLSTNYPHFNISNRGYNLLKDARVDFEFQESNLISEITELYDNYIDGITSYSLYLRNNTEKNFSSFQKKSWGVDFYNNKVTQGYVNYVKTNEYRSKVAYHYHFMKGPWKDILTKYENEIKKILKKINQSDYK